MPSFFTGFFSKLERDEVIQTKSESSLVFSKLYHNNPSCTILHIVDERVKIFLLMTLSHASAVPTLLLDLELKYQNVMEKGCSCIISGRLTTWEYVRYHQKICSLEIPV